MSSNQEKLNHHDAEISLAHIDNGISTDKHNIDAFSAPSQNQDESIDQPQGSPVDNGKNFNEFFDGKKDSSGDSLEIQAPFHDDELKSIDLNHDDSVVSRDKQSEFGYFPMDMQNQCGFDAHGNPIPTGQSESAASNSEQSSHSRLLKDKGEQVMQAIEGYQNRIRAHIDKIDKPMTWSEMMDNVCDFMQKPMVLITMLLLVVLIYLSAQNGAMQRELNEMHSKLDKFEAKEHHLQKEIKNMTQIIKDVKTIEDDLITKENMLQKKVEDQEKENEKKKENGEEWGADEVHQHPLIPHFDGPHMDIKEKLHEIGEKIHNRVMDLRKELFGKHGHHHENKDNKHDDEPKVHVIRMHAPPFFPGFLNFNDDD